MEKCVGMWVEVWESVLGCGGRWEEVLGEVCGSALGCAGRGMLGGVELK